MKGLNLTRTQLVHNSGQDIWDYMFENQPLKYKGNDEDNEEETAFYDESIDWLVENLLDGEVFEIFKDDTNYAFTSLGRHVNLKKRAFKKLALQGNAICGNIKKGAVSLTKLVKETWDIDLDYKKLPYECHKNIRIANGSKPLKEWIRNNYGS